VRVTHITGTFTFDHPSTDLLGCFSYVHLPLVVILVDPFIYQVLLLVGLSNITHTNPLAKASTRIICSNILHIFLD